MIIVNDLKPGSNFEYEGNIYQVLNLALNSNETDDRQDQGKECPHRRYQ